MNGTSGSIALAFPHTPASTYNHLGGSLQDIKAAQLVYSGHFSGLDSYGASGMTILEELTDLALRVCENGRLSGQKHHSRGSALLTGTGKVYTGCDVYVREGDPNGVSAERAALLAAVADGASVFHCLVVTTGNTCSTQYTLSKYILFTYISFTYPTQPT